MAEKVLYEKEEDIAIARINYPEHLNSLAPEVCEGLREVFATLEQDDEVRVLILTGTGKAFCAGADVSSLKRMELSFKSIHRELESIFQVFALAEKATKPVIAAVNGYALGGGLELCLACDIVIAAENAQFGTPEPRLGLMPGFAMTRLPAIVGRAKAKEILMTTNFFTAEEFLRLGIINKVVPPDKLMEASREMAKTIAQHGPLAISLLKEAVNRHLGGDEDIYALDVCTSLYFSEDAKEGIAAFLQKRTPTFKGK